MSIKENWLREDEVCPNCHQVTKRVRGITKQNLKRLLIPQWNFNEFLITFILIMVLVLALVYQNETKTTREWLSSMMGSDKDMCRLNCDNKCDLIYSKANYTNDLPQLNLSGMNKLIVTNASNQSNE